MISKRLKSDNYLQADDYFVKTAHLQKKTIFIGYAYITEFFFILLYIRYLSNSYHSHYYDIFEFNDIKGPRIPLRLLL